MRKKSRKFINYYRQELDTCGIIFKDIFCVGSIGDTCKKVMKLSGKESILPKMGD